jgi:hypothetical protein
MHVSIKKIRIVHTPNNIGTQRVVQFSRSPSSFLFVSNSFLKYARLDWTSKELWYSFMHEF